MASRKLYFDNLNGENIEIFHEKRLYVFCEYSLKQGKISIYKF